jgi:hypothetical protein
MLESVIAEFEPVLDRGALEDLHKRLDRWQGVAVDFDGWSRGVPRQSLAELGELAERYFTIQLWDEHDRGGHVPAVAEPALFAAAKSIPTVP